MEKAILKTLIYASIFDYPLKINEIHKWLIGKNANLRQVEYALERLIQKSKIKKQKNYYFLIKNGQVIKRKYKEKQSLTYFKKAQMLSQAFKIIPWVKLVGVSGGLALNNASKKDDIDLFIITAKKRLWISRLLILVILTLVRQRRKRQDKSREAAGKLCVNILLEEDKLEQENKDLYTAHEVLQMKVLWQRGEIYGKYLEDNSWAMEFLPNWIGNNIPSLRGVKRSRLKSRILDPTLSASERSNLVWLNPKSRLPHLLRSLAMTKTENFARWLQLKIMNKPQGMERIEDGALYFHPNDCRKRILKEYKSRLKIF